jgi:type VI secretion system lysozyme-like protein
MAQLRLLKRMQQWQHLEGETLEVDDVRLIESILADIENLLNTIQGTALIHDQLGLSDVKKLFVSHGNVAQDVISEEIRSNLQTFEPRLDRFTLEKDETVNAGALRWLLRGEVPVRDRVLPVRADISLTADGRISLSLRG